MRKIINKYSFKWKREGTLESSSDNVEGMHDGDGGESGGGAGSGVFPLPLVALGRSRWHGVGNICVSELNWFEKAKAGRYSTEEWRRLRRWSEAWFCTSLFLFFILGAFLSTNLSLHAGNVQTLPWREKFGSPRSESFVKSMFLSFFFPNRNTSFRRLLVVVGGSIINVKYEHLSLFPSGDCHVWFWKKSERK